MGRPPRAASIAMKRRSGDNGTDTNGEILLGAVGGVGAVSEAKPDEEKVA